MNKQEKTKELSIHPIHKGIGWLTLPLFGAWFELVIDQDFSNYNILKFWLGLLCLSLSLIASILFIWLSGLFKPRTSFSIINLFLFLVCLMGSLSLKNNFVKVSVPIFQTTSPSIPPIIPKTPKHKNSLKEISSNSSAGVSIWFRDSNVQASFSPDSSPPIVHIKIHCEAFNKNDEVRLVYIWTTYMNGMVPSTWKEEGNLLDVVSQNEVVDKYESKILPKSSLEFYLDIWFSTGDQRTKSFMDSLNDLSENFTSGIHIKSDFGEEMDSKATLNFRQAIIEEYKKEFPEVK